MVEGKEPSKEELRTKRILDAAMVCFATHGFDATKLADIAKDADVAVGTIYLRYKGKAELLGAVITSIEDGFCEAMDDQAIWDAPFPKRFEIIMTRVMTFADSAEQLGPLMAMAPYGVFEEGRSGDKVRAKIAEHLADGVAKGQLRANVNPARAAILAHGMVEGAMIDHMMNRNTPKEKAIAELVDASTLWLGKS